MRCIGTALLLITVAVLSSCGDDSGTSAGASATVITTTEAPSTTQSAMTTSTAVPASSATVSVPTSQPAIWPASGVVFETPEAAAADFVQAVLGVPPALGEFQQGDSRSGEMDVYSKGPGGPGTPVVRSTLLLRQLGSHDGWFVIAAVNPSEAIASPVSGAEITPGPLTVQGVGRGFEANVVVRAFVAEQGGAELDREITQGGSAEQPLPWTVTLDLSGAAPGTVVTLLVRGGTGLETDPGDFAAIPVVVAG